MGESNELGARLSSTMDFEVSALNLAGLKKVLVARGLAAQVLARVSPEAKKALDDPHTQKWHPGRFAIEAWGAVIDVAGGPTLSDVQLDVTSQAFGAIVTPLLKVALALGGRSPNSLLKRLDDAVKVATKHVRCSWRPLTPQQSSVVFEYPEVPARIDVIEHGWKGTLRFGETLVDKTFTFAPMVAETDRRFVLTLSW